MNPGDQVRLKTDPSRSGVLVKARPKGPLTLWLVRFPDVPSWIPEEQLEPESETLADPLELLADGQVAGVSALRRQLTHVRLSGRLANVVYSMETTNTDYYPHQFKPVLKLLNSPANGLLIADEVGLGKTIEAGLVWTELRSRYDAQRLVVLCPAVLQAKWKAELYDRFGVEAEIADAKRTLEVLQAGVVEGQARGFALIGSLQGLRPRRGWADLEEDTTHAGTRLALLLRAQAEAEPLIDLLVIDEAHYLRNPESMNAAIGRLLKSVSEHALLLSATPVHLRSEDLYYQLNLLDEDTFNDPRVFDEVLAANAPLVQARDLVLSPQADRGLLLDVLRGASEHYLLADSRQLRALIEEVEGSPDLLADRGARADAAWRLETLNLLGHVVSRTRKREVTEWVVQREAIAEPVPMTSVEAEFYALVTQTVRDYAERVGGVEAFLVCMPQRQISSSMPAALRHWQSKCASSSSSMEANTDELYEDLGYQSDEDDRPGPLVGEIVRRVARLADLDELERNDSKYARFETIVRQFLATYPGEKLVVFSYFRATLGYLFDRLAARGIEAVVLSGSSGLDKSGVLDRFRDADGPRILLSSEVGSEGIDLQFCRVLINYDLPWNPMRVEQRIGRLDRLGQAAKKITIWNLFYQGTIDDRIYLRLYVRLQIFQRALGGLEEILGQQVQKLTLGLLAGKLTSAQEDEAIERAAQVLENIRHQEEQLEANAANLVAYGDYILNQVKAARELKRLITGSDIENYVVDYLHERYPGSRFVQLEPGSGVYDVELSAKAKAELGQFVERNRLQRFTALHRPASGALRCRFENRVARPGTRTVELLGQLHPLVRFVSANLRLQIERGDRPFWPAIAARIDAGAGGSGVTPGQYGFAVFHWTVQALQPKDQLHYAAAPLGVDALPLADEAAERLVGVALAEGMEWLEAKHGVGVDLEYAADTVVGLYGDSNGRYEAFVQRTTDENVDRVNVQIAALDRHLDNQVRKLEDIRQRLLMASRRSLAKATDGRIAKLQERVEIRRLRIESGREVRARSELICVGIIEVH
ncbi:MAG: DEAD/DEAH box helicase [Burkholderiales bacterium]|nr:DEAD/DEAH box helicase [Burkholderiales bacterium]